MVLQNPPIIYTHPAFHDLGHWMAKRNFAAVLKGFLAGQSGFGNKHN
jgi:hypothetical protein